MGTRPTRGPLAPAAYYSSPQPGRLSAERLQVLKTLLVGVELGVLPRDVVPGEEIPVVDDSD